MDYLQYFTSSSACLATIKVLNLIINGLPSIHKSKKIIGFSINERVLNLIINGLPSIPK